MIYHQAIDSITNQTYRWSAESYDHGAGYPGPNEPTNILVIAGLRPGGSQGPQGPQGLQGAPGAQGAQGVPGTRGSRWTSVTAAPTFPGIVNDHCLNVTNGDVYTCAAPGVNWAVTGNIRGPAGGPAPDWHATVDGAGEPIAPADVQPTHITNSRGIQIGYDSTTGAAILSTNFDVPNGPVPSWYASSDNRYPVSIGSGAGITLTHETETNSVTVSTNFEVPSAELNWSIWSQPISVGSGTSYSFPAVSMTDTGRANTTWQIELELEAIVRRQSDASVMGLLRNSLVLSAVYNASGVPTLGTIAANPTQFRYYQANELGLPAFTGLDASQSAGTITVFLTKAADGNATYAKYRIRRATEVQMTPQGIAGTVGYWPS